MKKSRKNPLFRRILAATLLVGGAFQLAVPVLAQTAPSTAANTSISNRVTATYDNADATTPTFNATSNTVTITVAEVAGITITGTAVDVNGGTLQPNDVINMELPTLLFQQALLQIPLLLAVHSWYE